MTDCAYIHKFPCFPGGVEERPCLLEVGHSGDHVVIEPKEGKRLAVPRDGSARPRIGHANVRESIAILFPPHKDFS